MTHTHRQPNRQTAKVTFIIYTSKKRKTHKPFQTWRTEDTCWRHHYTCWTYTPWRRFSPELSSSSPTGSWRKSSHRFYRSPQLCTNNTEESLTFSGKRGRRRIGIVSCAVFFFWKLWISNEFNRVFSAIKLPLLGIESRTFWSFSNALLTELSSHVSDRR